jgi:hypothetical protein
MSDEALPDVMETGASVDPARLVQALGLATPKQTAIRALYTLGRDFARNKKELSLVQVQLASRPRA